MRRQINLLDFALRSLGRHWPRQLALWVLYALVVAFYASVVFFTEALRRETEAVLPAAPDLWVQQLTGGRLVLIPAAWADSIRTYRVTDQVRGRVWGYNYDSPTGGVFTVLGADSVGEWPLLATRYRGQLDSTQVLVGTGLLEARGLEVGDRLTLFDSRSRLRSFTIAGAFEAPSDLLTRDLIVLADAAARNVLGIPPGYVTDIGVRVRNPDEVSNLGSKIDREFAGVRVVTRAQLRNTYGALFGYRGGLLVFGSLLAGLAFLLLVFDRAGGLHATERRELGILKALGWGIGDVLWVKFWEGISLSLTATLAGLLLAYAHVFWLHAPLLAPLLTGWSVVLPVYRLAPVVSGGSVLTVMALAVVPYLTAALVPAWRGAITDPASILR